jgi:excisionase family DNA binding protein
MIVLSPYTASTLSPHTVDQSWVIFVQANPPTGGMGPILIEGVKGPQIATRLRALAAANAFDTFIIGLTPTTTPNELAKTIQAQHEAAHLHHDWYAPTVELLTFIQHTSQNKLAELLAAARPGGIPDNAVTIEEIAALIGVSVSTVRRLVKDGEIPYLRMGKALRFMPADVIGSLERRNR